MSGLEVLGGISNIAHILNVILRHVSGYCQLKCILETAASNARKIQVRIQTLQHLDTLDGVQSGILRETIQEFEDIEAELKIIQEKVENRSTARNFLTAPSTAAELNGIARRLAAKVDTLKLLGMIGVLNLEQRRRLDELCANMDEIKASLAETKPLETIVKFFFQNQIIGTNVQDITKGRKGSRADQMSGFTQLSTGVCLYRGEFGVKNYALAAQNFHAAAKAGWTHAYRYLGLLHKYGKGVERCNISAKNLFELGTNAGDPAAMVQLGLCYVYGKGVEPSPLKFVELIKRGAEAGDPLGMSIHAWTKLQGHCTDLNLPLAFRMSEEAVKKGYGQDTLACCYEQGIVVESNPVRSFELYSEAVEDCGRRIATLDLARCYEEGIGVEVNLEKAAQLYKRGTNFSWERPLFQAHYGMCLIRGRGIREDKKKGWAEVQKSIIADNARGWFVKGECYRLGYGVDEPNHVMAANCYRRATRAANGTVGRINAHFALGRMYELCQGELPHDLTQAFEHFNFAANRMHQGAQWKVAIFCESGTGVDIFVDRAVHYFRLAANSGHRKAQIKAAKYYMKGKGISRDLHTAVQILRPAAENGNREAQRLLWRLQLSTLLRRDSPFRTRSAPPRIG